MVKVAWMMLAQVALASGSVVYSAWSSNAQPHHALLVFIGISAVLMFALAPYSTLTVLRNKTYRRIATISGILNFLYFYCLLTGLQSAGPSIATLVLSASICTNGVVAILAMHSRLERRLALFTVAIFIVIYFIKTDGKPSVASVDKSLFLLLGALACEALNSYVRVVWSRKAKVLEKDFPKIPPVALILCIIPAALSQLLDLFPNTASPSWSSYTQSTWFSWIYLAMVPNLVMVTVAARYERLNPIAYHSLGSMKFLGASFLMLIVPSAGHKNILENITAFCLMSISLLVILIYLFNSLNTDLKKLAH